MMPVVEVEPAVWILPLVVVLFQKGFEGSGGFFAIVKASPGPDPAKIRKTTKVCVFARQPFQLVEVNLRATVDMQ